MKREYKIVEGMNGGYFILTKVITTKGMLWWEKTTEEWLDIDHYGEPYYYNDGHPLGGFINLKDAQIAIKMIKNKKLKANYCGD